MILGTNQRTGNAARININAPPWAAPNTPLPRSRPTPGELGWRVWYNATEAAEAEWGLSLLARAEALPSCVIAALACRLQAIIQRRSAGGY